VSAGHTACLEVGPRRRPPVPAQPTLTHRVAAAAPARSGPVRAVASAAAAAAPTVGTPVLGPADLDDLASLGEVDTGAPDGTPDDPLDILERHGAGADEAEVSGAGDQLYLMAESGQL